MTFRGETLSLPSPRAHGSHLPDRRKQAELEIQKRQKRGGSKVEGCMEEVA